MPSRKQASSECSHALLAAPGRPPWSPRASRGSWRARRPGELAGASRSPQPQSLSRHVLHACTSHVLHHACAGVCGAEPSLSGLKSHSASTRGVGCPAGSLFRARRAGSPPRGSRRRPGRRGGDAAWASVTHGQFVWCMDRDEALPEAGCRRLDHRSENEPAWLLKKLHDLHRWL